MTIVSHAHKYIFIRPRKVAGMSIQVSLSHHAGPSDIASLLESFDPHVDEDDCSVVHMCARQAPYGRHALPDEVRQDVGEEVWQRYFKFTVARNPWDLLLSYVIYKFSHVFWRQIWGDRSPLDTLRNVPRALRLQQLRSAFQRGRGEETLESVLRERLFDGVEEIPRFYLSRGVPYADGVIHFENLQEDYDSVCERLGLPRQSLPRLHTKPRPNNTDYRDYYTDYSREYVAHLCAAMTEDFGYRFDDGT